MPYFNPSTQKAKTDPLYKFKGSLIYIRSPRPVRATKWDPVSKQNKSKQTKNSHLLKKNIYLNSGRNNANAKCFLNTSLQTWYSVPVLPSGRYMTLTALSTNVSTAQTHLRPNPSDTTGEIAMYTAKIWPEKAWGQMSNTKDSN